MTGKIKLHNTYASRTLAVLVAGLLPVIILAIIPKEARVFITGAYIFNSYGGVYSLNSPDLSLLFNNYTKFFAPLSGLLSFIWVRKCVNYRSKFESQGKFYFSFLQYVIFVMVVYYLFYFCHLELTRANYIIRGLTDSGVGFWFFNLGIVFPALFFATQILLIYSTMVIKSIKD